MTTNNSETISTIPPVSKSITSATPASAVSSSETEVEVPDVSTVGEAADTLESSEDDLDIDALLKDDEVEAPAEQSTLEFDKFSEQFEKVLGIKLEDAQNWVTTLKQEMAQVTAQRDLLSLSQQWGVTGPELDRRINEVLKVVNKMTPEQQTKYDSIEGINQLWDKISKAKGRKAPSVGGQDIATDAKKTRFTTSELKKMMRENPALYNSKQAEIAEALRLGLVEDDL